MESLFEAIRQVVATAITGDYLSMGQSIVDIVASAVNIPISVAEWILRLMGVI
ncbi:hypothetical protein A5881_003871 [Enterococcus termitis]|nr:hypothetical protein A5881_003743 [Enterococcus termitis]